MSAVHFGDCREVMRRLIGEGTQVQMCVTSPPYWGLRDYGVEGQLGLEDSPHAFVDNMVEVFALVWELLADDGTLWLNLGDSYAASGRGGGGGGKNDRDVGRRISKRNSRRAPPGHGLKQKDLVGGPWRVAFALQDWGWYLRQDIIWHKPNPMPESVSDRCTKAHEYLFLLSKSPQYYYDNDAIREPCQDKSGQYKTPDGWDTSKGEGGHGSLHRNGREKGNVRSGGVSAEGYDDRKWQDRSDGLARPPMTMKDRAYNPLGRNKRSVWTVSTEAFSGAHFATFPQALIQPCILAGSRTGDTVLDPFFGSGTTGQVCNQLGREYLGIELNEEYEALQLDRTAQLGMPL